MLANIYSMATMCQMSFSMRDIPQLILSSQQPCERSTIGKWKYREVKSLFQASQLVGRGVRIQIQAA